MIPLANSPGPFPPQPSSIELARKLNRPRDGAFFEGYRMTAKTKTVIVCAQEIKLVERKCKRCRQRFLVMKKSQQKHCSQLCQASVEKSDRHRWAHDLNLTTDQSRRKRS